MGRQLSVFFTLLRDKIHRKMCRKRSILGSRLRATVEGFIWCIKKIFSRSPYLLLSSPLLSITATCLSFFALIVLPGPFFPCQHFQILPSLLPCKFLLPVIFALHLPQISFLQPFLTLSFSFPTRIFYAFVLPAYSPHPVMFVQLLLLVFYSSFPNLFTLSSHVQTAVQILSLVHLHRCPLFYFLFLCLSTSSCPSFSQFFSNPCSYILMVLSFIIPISFLSTPQPPPSLSFLVLFPCSGLLLPLLFTSLHQSFCFFFSLPLSFFSPAYLFHSVISYCLILRFPSVFVQCPFLQSYLQPLLCSFS